MILLLPVTLLAPELRLARWLPAMAVFSMAPLLRRDGLALASVAVLLVWLAVVGRASAADRLAARTKRHASSRRSISGDHARRKREGSLGSIQGRVIDCVAWLHDRIAAIAVISAAAVCAAVALTRPPARYPFLHDAAFTCVSFLFFGAAMCELAVETYNL